MYTFFSTNDTNLSFMTEENSVKSWWTILRAAQIQHPFHLVLPTWGGCRVDSHGWCLGQSGPPGDADLLSVSALRLKCRMIWWSGSGCFSISSSSSSSTLGDFYTNNTDKSQAWVSARAKQPHVNREKAKRKAQRALDWSRRKELRYHVFLLGGCKVGYTYVYIFFPANQRNIPILG